MEVKVKSTKTGRELAVDYDFGGTTTAELVEKHGEEVVFNAVIAQWKIGLQAAIRSTLDNDENSIEDAKAVGAEWKPGVARKGGGGGGVSLNKLIEQLKDPELSEDEKQKVYEKIQNRLAAEEAKLEERKQLLASMS